jgi:hypothetical protein
LQTAAEFSKDISAGNGFVHYTEAKVDIHRYMYICDSIKNFMDVSQQPKPSDATD